MYRLLIVDDEETIRLGLKNIINWSEHNYQIVDTASNGIQALDIISNNEIDIVITDIMMPEMDGIELSKKVRQNFPNIQILVLSSYDDFKLVSNSYKQGIADYLLKPELNPENLLSALEKISLNITERDKTRKISERDISIEKLNRYLSGFSNQDDFLRQLFKFDSFFFYLWF